MPARIQAGPSEGGRVMMGVAIEADHIADETHLAAWLRFADGLRRYRHAHPGELGLRVTVGGESVDVLFEAIFAITGMAQRAAELEAALRWIPVTERLPNQWDVVQVWAIDLHVSSAWLDDQPEWVDRAGLLPARPTHWRPLPPGPEVGQ